MKKKPVVLLENARQQFTMDTSTFPDHFSV